jgi:hypothetical protein
MISRRKLLLGATAIVVAPAVPPVGPTPAWVPNPSIIGDTVIVSQTRYYGGARGGGKMFSTVYGQELRDAFINGPHPWRE